MLKAYILKTSVGVMCQATVEGESFHFHWTPPPPHTQVVIEQIAAEYIPWRNQIFADYTRRTGKRILLVTL